MQALSQQQPQPLINAAMETPKRVLMIGVDIAKATHVARVVRGTNEALKDRCCFSSRPHDLERFAVWVRDLQRRYQATSIFIGMEPTGPYWRPVYAFASAALPECGSFLVSPAAVYHSRFIRDSNLGKDDDRDALLIAGLLVQNRCLRPLSHTPLTTQLRESLRLYHRAQSMEQQSRQQLLAMLDRCFPSALDEVGSAAVDGVLTLLHDTPTPALICAAPEDAWVARHRTKGRRCAALRSLYQRALAALPTAAPLDTAWLAIWHGAWNAWHAARSCKQQYNAAIAALLAPHSVTAALSTVPTVSTITVAAFLAGAGDLAQYQRAAQVEKVFGLDLVRRQSGKTELTPALSKRGYALGRQYLYLAALRLIKREPFSTWYNRRCSTRPGAGNNRAVWALTAKLIRVMFHIARTGESFDPQRAVTIVEHEQHCLPPSPSLTGTVS